MTPVGEETLFSRPQRELHQPLDASGRFLLALSELPAASRAVFILTCCGCGEPGCGGMSARRACPLGTQDSGALLLNVWPSIHGPGTQTRVVELRPPAGGFAAVLSLAPDLETGRSAGRSGPAERPAGQPAARTRTARSRAAMLKTPHSCVTGTRTAFLNGRFRWTLLGNRSGPSPSQMRR